MVTSRVWIVLCLKFEVSWCAAADGWYSPCREGRHSNSMGVPQWQVVWQTGASDLIFLSCSIAFLNRQVIEDKKIGLNITASFIKEDNGMLSEMKGRWKKIRSFFSIIGRFSVRIEGSTKRLKQEYTLLYYVGIENQIKSSNLTGSWIRINKLRLAFW